MTEVELELNKFAKEVIRQSRSNLTRKGKRVGNKLYNSLDYALAVSQKGTSFSLEFEMADYGDFVDRGVSGKKKKYDTPFSFKSKWPPRKEILKWVNAKRLRLRDPETGRFKKGGQESLAFLIQRSIFNKGIKPSLFFTKPFENAFKALPPDLEKAFALDVEDLIEFTFRKNGTNTQLS